MAVSAQGDNLKQGPFDGLEARFTANANTLYNLYSTRERGDGTTQDQPFLEIKPNDPSREDVNQDSRFAPIFSVKRDITRIANGFLVSPEGQLFASHQAQQQMGNTFSETQQLNSQFIVGNLTPYLHLERPASDASQIQFINADGAASPASLDPAIGMAGRLQQSTAAAIVGQVAIKDTSVDGLLATLNSGNLLGALAGMLNGGANAGLGPEGENQRPEFNINGQWYSITQWQAFQAQSSVVNNLTAAVSNLQNGNVFGAINQVESGVSSVLNGAQNLDPISGVLTGNRGVVGNTEVDGSRYFITTPGTADRYLQNAIGYTVNSLNQNIPFVTLNFLEPLPYLLPPAPIPQPQFQNLNDPSNAQQQSGLQLNVNSLVKSALQTVSATGLLGGSNILSAIASFASMLIPSTGLSTENPAESDMLFPQLSLDQRYEAVVPNLVGDQVAFIQQVLINQQTYEQAYWAQNQPTLGFVGGLQPTGQPASIDYQSRNQNTTYFHDRMNELGVLNDAGTNVISQQTIQSIQQNFATDLVNVFFYDVVNQKAVPFRAFIANLQETITPEIDDTRYIGRIDRNVVYKGATRELSLGLYVHAMNDSEMTNVWQKVNYMTGLCFPSKYVAGYMVPPLVRLTIGDFYRDQPGYIRSLTHQIEQDTPWETTQNYQAPHGLLMSVVFSVIEQAPVQAGFQFYPFGTSRTPASPNQTPGT